MKRSLAHTKCYLKLGGNRTDFLWVVNANSVYLLGGKLTPIRGFQILIREEFSGNINPLTKGYSEIDIEVAKPILCMASVPFLS